MATEGENTATSGPRVHQPHAAFITVIIAGAVYGGGTTLPNVVLPQMQGDLSVSLDQISWIVTASIVAGAIGMPPTPWLAARFGIRGLFIASLVLFTITSTMIGLSNSIAEVVLWRVMQAMTGAPIMVLSQTVAVSLYPSERRGTTMGIWSMGLTSSWVFAPVVGAYLTDIGSWRLAFIGLAPVAILAIVLCSIFLPPSKKDSTLRFDWTGFIALSVALATLQVVLSRGQRLDWFDSPVIVTSTIVGLVALYFFVTHTLTCERPFFRWEVFRDRNLSVGLVLTLVFSFVSFAPLVLIPSMLESIRGLEVTTIGQMNVPRGIIQCILFALIGPLIGRVDSRLMVTAGFAIFAAGAWQMSAYNMSIGLADVMVPLALQGIAMALMWLPVFHMMYLTLEPKYHTEVGSLVGLAYSISSSVGIAVSVTMLGRSTQTSNEELGAHIVPTNERLWYPEYSDWSLDTIESLAAIQAEVAQQALMIAYVNVFWMLGVVCVAAIPIAVFLGSSGRAR